MENMNYLLTLFVIILSLISWSSASDHMILFSDQDKKLRAEYGDVTTSNTLKLDFYECNINDTSRVCLTKRQNPRKYANYFSASERQECNHFQRVAQFMDDVLKFCVDMENANWYGGAETTYQYWPLNKFNWTDIPFVTNDYRAIAALESYFFNSNGFYIHIDESVALFVDINGLQIGKMCFTAKILPPYRKSRNVMQFRVCKFSNAREAHENAIKDFLGKPNAMPDIYIIENPIWSTWARYKSNLNSTIVYGYAQEIVRYGYPKGTFEIDDGWESCYGSAQFNISRFENIKELVSRLKSDGFRTSLWAHPFINLDCDKHQIGESRGYFVRSISNSSNTTWWRGKASQIDFTNPEAATWWANDFRTLLATSGIDTLKFDAGESSWVPPSAVYYDNDLTYYPDNIATAYLNTIMQFGNGIEYRTSRRSQDYGRFLRMIDRESQWGFYQGLSTLITGVLQLNMIGYPFLLPDMIGGNGYNYTPPTKEMFIRWMEANVFLPAIQFSYAPWDYDQQTIDVCKQFMDLRSKHTDTIIKLMRNSISNGSPVNPPIWWIDPTDPVAQIIDDEYLLGETILVAPVLEDHAISRDVYLPAGLWRDENNPNSPLINGRTWLRNYPAYINVLPWFTKVGEYQQPSNSIIHVSSKAFILALSLIVYIYR